MAHFYAGAKGSRGEIHRLGGKSSGADVSVRGWKDGINVYASFNEDTQENEYKIYSCGGSSSVKTISLAVLIERSSNY